MRRCYPHKEDRMNTEFLVMALPVLLASGFVPIAILLLGCLLLQQRER